MVAKSYQGLEIVKEPYMANGRMYVQVKMANGCSKQVRWYTDKEYAKYYGTGTADTTQYSFVKTQREVLGFVDGFITIFKGDTYSYKEWLKEIGCKYTKLWGWGLASNLELPELPVGIEAIRLDWSAVGADEENLKNDDAVKAVIESLMYEPSNSKFVGQVGERLEVEVVVEKAIFLQSRFGASILHSMKDANDNTYVWITSSKNWQEGSKHHIRGTVKEHKTYKNICQTVLTRCVEVGKK